MKKKLLNYADALAAIILILGLGYVLCALYGSIF